MSPQQDYTYAQQYDFCGWDSSWKRREKERIEGKKCLSPSLPLYVRPSVPHPHCK